MSSTRTVRHIRASRPAIYAALLDAALLARWRVPEGMTSIVHEFDPRVGGAFRISLTYDTPTTGGKTTARTDTYSGHFVELVPDTRVAEVFAFDTTDSALMGSVTMTTSLRDADGGTEVVVEFDGLPPGVSPADNDLGTRMALDNLAALVEGRFESGRD